MVLLTVKNNLFPHSVNVLFGKVDPVIRQREVGGKVSIFHFERFLLPLEFDYGAIRILESVKYIGAEAKFREGIVRI